MANFETGIGAPQGSPVTPQEPVVDQSGSGILENINAAAKTALSISTTLGQGDDNSAISAALKEFDRRANTIGSVFKTGEINKAKARIELNRAWQSAVQSNPDARTALNDSYTKHGTSFGITAGKTLDQAQDEKKIESAEWAIENGYATDGMTPEQFQEGVIAGEAMRVHLQRLDSQNKILQNINTKVDLSEKVRGVQEAQARREVENILRGISETSYVKYEGQTKAILDGYEANKTAEGQADSLSRLAALRADLQTELARISQGRVDKQFLSSMSEAHTTILDLAERRIKGEISKDVLTREIERTKLQSQSEALQNPEIRRINGLVSLVGDNIVTQVMATKLASTYMANYTENGELPKPTPENTENAGVFSNMFKDVAKFFNSSTLEVPTDLKDRDIGELQTYSDAAVDAMTRDVVDRPSDIKGIIDFFADRHVHSLYNKGELARPKDAQGISNLIEVHFTSNVISSMNNVLGQQITFEGKQIPIDDVFERKIEGGRYRFVRKPEFESLTLLRRDPKAILSLRGQERRNALASSGGLTKAEQSLRGLTNTLNRTIMAISTLTGDTPAQAAQQIEETLFNVQPQEEGLRPDELGVIPEENRVPSLKEQIDKASPKEKRELLETLGFTFNEDGSVGIKG